MLPVMSREGAGVRSRSEACGAGSRGPHVLHLCVAGSVCEDLAPPPTGLYEPSPHSPFWFQVLPLLVFWAINLSAKGEGPRVCRLVAFGFPAMGLRLVPVGRAQAWVAQPSGVGQAGGGDHQDDLRVRWSPQALNENNDEEEARESEFTSER